MKILRVLLNSPNWNLCICVCVCVNLVAMATPFAPLKFLLAYLNLPTPKTLYYTCKHCLYILYRTEICAILVYFWPNFCCRGNSLGSLGNSGSIFKFTNSVHLTIGYLRKIPLFFAQNWNLCYLCLFLAKFGYYFNSLGSLEISDSIFEFADPVNLIIHVEKSSIFAQNCNRCNFALFLPKFGCHGNCLGSLQISDSIFNFADIENLTIPV